MENIAFIDLKFHKKTKSSDFFKNILSERFNVTVFYEDERKKYINGNFNKYIFWQVIPDFLDLIKIRDKQIIFIPMYDGLTLNKLARERYKCFKIKIVCFCKKVYEFFTDMGFECFYIQYFLPPLKYDVDYSKKKVFFWYRGNITWDMVKTIIGDQKVEVTIKNNPDPGYQSLDITNGDIEKYRINFQDKFFESKDDYFKMFSQHSIFIAPRNQEGIGMSFLESMSMGQCVIAYDDATMNEYIVNNENGILTKFDNKISLEDYESIGKNAKLKYKLGLVKWDSDIDLCINFIKNNYINKAYKEVAFIDYIIDVLIKIRRAGFKLKRSLFK